MKSIRNIFIIICSLIIVGQASGSGMDLAGPVSGGIHSGTVSPVISAQTPDIQGIPERNPVSDIPGIVGRSPDISLPPLQGEIAGTTTLGRGNDDILQRSEPAQSASVPGRIIVKYKTSGAIRSASVQAASDELNTATGATIRKDSARLGVEGMQVLELPGNVPIEKAIAVYEKHPLVEYAEPDYICSIDRQANDPRYRGLWGLRNTGQGGGIRYVDIRAPQAWDISTGTGRVIVAVVDTGVDYLHPDLRANIVQGYNAITGTLDPMDDNGHGTHCAGTIGAVGNNRIGVTGVNWRVKIMPLKFLDSSGNGAVSDAIEAITWGYNHGARIFSNSWGTDSYSKSLKNTIDRYPRAMFIAAAGNEGADVAVSPRYPAAFDSWNIISVGAHTRIDKKAWFSNWGRRSVDVFAPGHGILSTLPRSQGQYGWKSGTSMAVPHVSGIFALVKQKYPQIGNGKIKLAIMRGVVKKPEYTSFCVTGGRVNAYRALVLAPTIT